MNDEATSGLRLKDTKWSSPVTIFVNDKTVPAYDGEMLGPALLSAGYRFLNQRLRNGRATGLFCLMGSCQECCVLVNGKQVLSCQHRVSAGMRITLGVPT